MKSMKQRIYASLLALGAAILLFRTTSMVFGGSLARLALWVSILLIIEMIVDIICLFYSIRWWVSNSETQASLPLRVGAAAALLHAFRVLVFALGRTSLFYNFDVRPEYHVLHATSWSWEQVIFASIMSILGIAGVVVIWLLRRKKRKSKKTQNDSLNK